MQPPSNAPPFQPLSNNHPRPQTRMKNPPRPPPRTNTNVPQQSAQRGELPECLIDETAEAVKARFLQFLLCYGQDHHHHHQDLHAASTSNYAHQAEVMRNSETTSLFVDFMHVKEYDEDLANVILIQYYRWESYLRRAIFEFIRMEDRNGNGHHHHQYGT